MIGDVALPIPYDWFLLGSRLLIAAVLLTFLWRVMIVVGRDTFAASPSRRRPMTIGRDSSNDIVLTDRSVSGHHAVVRYIAGEWVIGDLDSRNGTLVNGELITGETSIVVGDVVQFGAVRARLVSNESQF
jgi:pSer/pThr/pTyr-binding forkhead associated (FHA) protein